MDSLFGYLDYASGEVEWVVTENVKTVFDRRAKFKGEVPWLVQEQKFKQRGFVPFKVLAKAHSFTLKQHRDRGWGIHFRLNKLKAFLPCPTSTFYTFQTGAMELDHFILQQHGRRGSSGAACVISFSYSAQRTKDDPQWHADLREQMDVFGEAGHYTRVRLSRIPPPTQTLGTQGTANKDSDLASSQPTSKRSSHAARQPTDQPASQPASLPASQPAKAPAIQPTQPAHQPCETRNGLKRACMAWLDWNRPI
jgi:hypothetical protein